MVLGALGCMNNADFERKKISKRRHCARCVYYLSYSWHGSIPNPRITVIYPNKQNDSGGEVSYH